MYEWWSGLTAIAQWFFIAAAFFSVFFTWQIIATLIGLAGDADADVDAGMDAHTDVDVDVHDMPHDIEATGDAADTIAAFRLVSIRSVLAFFTLFSWAGALYLASGVVVDRAIIYALLWGLAALVVVSLLLHFLRKLAETGSPQLATCVGQTGAVYLDIPPGGVGEVRVTVSGVVSHVKARAAGGAGISSGTDVRVLRILGPGTVEVDKVGESGKKGEDT